MKVSQLLIRSLVLNLIVKLSSHMANPAKHPPKPVVAAMTCKSQEQLVQTK